MIWNKQFDYPTSTRALINGKRHYDVGTQEKLPSVTTILLQLSLKKRKQYWPIGSKKLAKLRQMK
jgi:hypothetical protein